MTSGCGITSKGHDTSLRTLSASDGNILLVSPLFILEPSITHGFGEFKCASTIESHMSGPESVFSMSNP